MSDKSMLEWLNDNINENRFIWFILIIAYYCIYKYNKKIRNN